MENQNAIFAKLSNAFAMMIHFKNTMTKRTKTFKSTSKTALALS
jgi:hypothetical protein